MEEQGVRPPEGPEAGRMKKRKMLPGVVAPEDAALGKSPGKFFQKGPLCTDEGDVMFQQLWELMAICCDSWDDFQRKVSFLYSEFTGLSVLQLGISVMQLLLSMPREAKLRLNLLTRQAGDKGMCYHCRCRLWGLQ